MDRIAVRLIVRGRVQGVGYRQWTQDEARRLGLDGWVRNLRNGSVELVAAGPVAAVDRLAQACRRGPPSAAVERFEAEAAPLQGFEARPTADG